MTHSPCTPVSHQNDKNLIKHYKDSLDYASQIITLNEKQIMCYKILLCILTTHLAILFKLGLNEEVIVVEGQVAILPCESTLSSGNTSAETTLLRWFHNRYHKPLYTLDVRHINQQSKSFRWSDNNARHFPSPDYEGRLYLELNSEIPTLRIDPVLFDDRGRYTCQVDFRTSRSVSSYTELRVILPPKGVVIRDQEDRKVEGVIGPFNLGETLIITCEALGGDPPPLLSWSGTFDNSTGAYHEITTNTTSTIKIPRLQRNDQWTHFTCTARNSDLTLAKSSTVTVEINHNLVALHFKYDFWHMTAMAGSDVVQYGRPMFDDFFQHLWPYIGNSTANVVFQLVQRLWLIRIDE
ncbi:uncharacterized protein TNCV_1746281 [Trichonephila clavipes]|nr:uncharacterized protein TNCV_1746281 [Trichonephila clavipes]